MAMSYPIKDIIKVLQDMQDIGETQANLFDVELTLQDHAVEHSVQLATGQDTVTEFDTGEKDAVWRCDTCEFLNDIRFIVCPNCQLSRPDDPVIYKLVLYPARRN